MISSNLRAALPLEVKIGDRILVKILRVDAVERKIGLSKKRAEWSAEQEGEAVGEAPKPRRGGLSGTAMESGERLIDTRSRKQAQEESDDEE